MLWKHYTRNSNNAAAASEHLVQTMLIMPTPIVLVLGRGGGGVSQAGRWKCTVLAGGGSLNPGRRPVLNHQKGSRKEPWEAKKEPRGIENLARWARNFQKQVFLMRWIRHSTLQTFTGAWFGCNFKAMFVSFLFPSHTKRKQKGPLISRTGLAVRGGPKLPYGAAYKPVRGDPK